MPDLTETKRGQIIGHFKSGATKIRRLAFLEQQ